MKIQTKCHNAWFYSAVLFYWVYGGKIKHQKCHDSGLRSIKNGGKSISLWVFRVNEITNRIHPNYPWPYSFSWHVWLSALWFCCHWLAFWWRSPCTWMKQALVSLEDPPGLEFCLTHIMSVKIRVFLARNFFYYFFFYLWRYTDNKCV